VQLPTPLLDRLDIHQAVLSELEDPSDLLPSRVVEEAVRGHERNVAERVAGYARDASHVWQPAEIVWALKGPSRFRPAASVSLNTRILLRSLAASIETEGPGLDPQPANRGDFERSILEDAAITHVVSADVASFYEYVDHALLQSLIIDAIGRHDTAEAVVDLLNLVMQRGIGLPQGVRSSDVFADLVLAPVERRVRWQGIPVSRANDDFRIGGGSEADARDALAMLAEELRKLGLTLNDEKTRIVERSAYEKHVRSSGSDADLGGLEWDDEDLGPYAGTVAEEPLPRDAECRVPDGLEEREASVLEFLAPNLQRVHDQRRLSPTLRVNTRRKIGRGLQALTRLDSTALHDEVSSIMRWDPTLAPEAGSYLARAARRDMGNTIRTLEQAMFAGGDLASPWEVAWLVQPLLWGDAPRLQAGVSDSLVTLALRSSTPQSVSSRILHAMVVQGTVSPKEVSQRLTSTQEAAQGDLLAALSRSNRTSAAVRATLNDVPGVWIAQLYAEG
jgi:Reverse transcriptase (RNA-dependent DNA polymerase)